MYPDYVLNQLGRQKQQQLLKAARLEGTRRQARASRTTPRPYLAQPARPTFGRRLAALLGYPVAQQPNNTAA